MQKVSKQSLAMIALSILLAISIALTFTFAALSATGTATGNITFEGDATVKWSQRGNELSKYAVSNESITITLTEADFDFNPDGSASLSTTTKGEFEKVTVTIENTAASKLNYKISTSSNDNRMTVSSTTFNGNIMKSSGTISKTLSEIVTDIKIASAEDAEELQFIVTAEIGAAVAVA